jgi:hypothetical protein
MPIQPTRCVFCAMRKLLAERLSMIGFC